MKSGLPLSYSSHASFFISDHTKNSENIMFTHDNEMLYQKKILSRSLFGEKQKDYEKRYDRFSFFPKFECVFVMPSDKYILSYSLDSLFDQFYSHWKVRILISDSDFSPRITHPKIIWQVFNKDHELQDILSEIYLETRSDWIGFFPAGFVFSPNCFAEISSYLNLEKSNSWRFIYSDDDFYHRNENEDGCFVFSEPRFKPDFNLELLRSTDYIGHGFIYKNTILSILDKMDSNPFLSPAILPFLVYESFGNTSIAHVPEVLIHRHQEAYQADELENLAIVRKHLARLSISAYVRSEPNIPDGRRVFYSLMETPKVSIIIPNKNSLHLIKACIDSLLHYNDYPNFEILIVDNNSYDSDVIVFYSTLLKNHADQIRILYYQNPFNWSAMNNLGASFAKGSYFLFLNNDIECFQKDWLSILMSYANSPDVGIVGARLLFPETKCIQHVGIFIGFSSGAGHAYSYYEPHFLGDFGRAHLASEYAAVTGACLLIRSAIYSSIGGCNDKDFQVNFNDVDLSLRVREAGYRVICAPSATLLHHCAVSLKKIPNTPEHRLARIQERAAFVKQWSAYMANDPGWSRHFFLRVTASLISPEITWNPDFPDRPSLYLVQAPEKNNEATTSYLVWSALARKGDIYFSQRITGEKPPCASEMGRMRISTLCVASGFMDDLYLLVDVKNFYPEIFLVFYLDDHWEASYRHNHEASCQKAYFQSFFHQVLKLCDRLIVASEDLKAAYAPFAKEIFVVPNDAPNTSEKALNAWLSASFRS